MIDLEKCPLLILDRTDRKYQTIEGLEMTECLVIFSFTFRGFFFLVNFKSPYITMAKENFIRYILLRRLILN